MLAFPLFIFLLPDKFTSIFLVYLENDGRLTYLDSAQEAKIYMLVFLGFRPIVGQSWAQEPAQRPRLEKRSINQRKVTREIDYKAPQN